MKSITHAKLLELIRQRAKSVGNNPLARELGIDQSRLCRVLSGEREITNGTANAFGYERIVGFSRKTK